MQNTAITSSEASSGVPDWLEVVRQKVEQLKFGSVQVVVHEGRVTQVETIEKTRFNAGRESVAAPEAEGRSPKK